MGYNLILGILFVLFTCIDNFETVSIFVDYWKVCATRSKNMAGYYCSIFFIAVCGVLVGCVSASGFSTDVFVSVDAGGVDYPPCYRQPVLLAVDSSTLLAFSTGRNKTGESKSLCSDPGDGSPNYMCLKRSTDGGVSFHPLQILFAGSGATQPDFYVSYYDKELKQVELIFKTPNALLRMYSNDGLQWSTPEEIVPLFNRTRFQNIGPSVGKGIVLNLQGGQRTLLPFICSSKSETANGDKGACPTCHSCILSKQKGGWQIEAVASGGSRESQLFAFDTASDGPAPLVVTTERNMGKLPGHRKQAYSFDGGMSFADQTVSTVPEPATKNWTGIKAGLVGLANGLLVQSHPNSTSARKDLVLSVSADKGKSWEVGKLSVYHGLAGYSDIDVIADLTVGVLFENGEHGYADKISLAVVDMRELSSASREHRVKKGV